MFGRVRGVDNLEEAFSDKGPGGMFGRVKCSRIKKDFRETDGDGAGSQAML